MITWKNLRNTDLDRIEIKFLFVYLLSRRTVRKRWILFNVFMRSLIIFRLCLCSSARLFPWTLAIATIIPVFPVKRIPCRGIPQKFIDSQIASQADGGERLRRSLIKFVEELSFQNETTYGFLQTNFFAHDESNSMCEISINFAKYHSIIIPMSNKINIAV